MGIPEGNCFNRSASDEQCAESLPDVSVGTVLPEWASMGPAVQAMNSSNRFRPGQGPKRKDPGAVRRSREGVAAVGRSRGAASTPESFSTQYKAVLGMCKSEEPNTYTVSFGLPK